MAAVEIGAGAALGEGGRYRLQRLIGTGGMAAVWLATDSRLEREVAIKVLSDVLALDESYVARFEREARLAAGLSHPHLVNIYDFSVHGARPYLVLEYVASGTLADRLRTAQDRQLDPAVLALELFDAVGYIHDAGIIHRDIKPANVLIGIDGRARLTDFGIAQPPGGTRLTVTGQVMGTQRYIAPEVLHGHPANQRSDLYACGVLLGECLRPDTSPLLHRVVAVLTEHDPRRRPESAAAAIATLQATATAETRTLHKPARANRPRRAPKAALDPRPRITRDGPKVQRRLTRAAATTIAAAAGLLVALVLLVTTGGRSSSAPPSTAPTAPPASAPLSQQLDALDQGIDRARR